MKLIYFFLPILLFWSCSKRKSGVPTPEIPQELEPKVIYNFDTTAYSTQSPYLDIPDKGFEMHLVVMGYDKDNQVNGKVALEDIEKVSELFLGSGYVTDELKERYMYFSKKYKLAEKYYMADAVLPVVWVHDLSFIGDFKNLEGFGCHYCTVESIDFKDKVSHLRVMRISTSAGNLSISGIDSITTVHLGSTSSFGYYEDSTYIRSFHFTAPDLNTDLSHLAIGGIYLSNVGDVVLPERGGYGGLSINGSGSWEELDLSSNNRLKSISIDGAKNLKSLILPKGCYSIHLRDCPNLEILDLSRIENIRFGSFIQLPLIEILDLSRYFDIYSLRSEDNTNLKSIKLNKEQDTTIEEYPWGGVYWRKDAWTEWVY